MLAEADRSLYLTADSDLGTCAKANGTFSTLDYAVTDSWARYLILVTKVRLDVPMSPHRRVTFVMDFVAQRQVEISVRCPLLPPEAPVGPRPRPHDWRKELQQTLSDVQRFRAT